MPSGRRIRCRGDRGRGTRSQRDDRVVERASLPVASENAYRPLSRSSVTASREEELKRSVQSKLNKICPENWETILEKLGTIMLGSVEELSLMISLIFKKALIDRHWCETYADLVLGLNELLPEFADPDGGKPVTFKRALLTTVQDEYEALPKMLEPTDEERKQLEPAELAYQVNKKKGRFLANMQFIGHLFLRQLLPTKIISAVLQSLVAGETNETPHEHMLECALELVDAVAYTLESGTGKETLAQVCARLLDLKNQKDAGGRGIYSKRMQFRIQDLLDMRKAGWTKKMFKNQAKTKAAIAHEQERGLDDNGSQRVVAGARPAHAKAAAAR